MNTLKNIGAIIGALIIALVMVIGGWKLERWVNWKLDYGRKVDQRIERLEKRIEVLENGNRKDNL